MLTTFKCEQYEFVSENEYELKIQTPEINGHCFVENMLVLACDKCD